MIIKQRISDTVVKSLAHNVLRVNDNQISGFHLRLGKPNTNGVRRISYYFYYRLGGRNGRQVNFLIGCGDTLSAGEARRIAQQIQPLVQAGKDVQKLQLDAKNQPLKLKQFWRHFGHEFFIQKYRNSQDAIRLIESIVLPTIGSVSLDQISHQLIELRIAKPLIAKNNISTLRLVISGLRSLLKLAVELEMISVQPIKTIDLSNHLPAKGLTDTKLLSSAQLKGLYYRASKEPKLSVYLYTLRLQILSGQCLATICRAYRQDIKGNKWLLRNKDGKLSGTMIPIVGPLKQLLKEIIKLFSKARSLYLFAGRLRHDSDGSFDDDRPVDIRSLAKLQLNFIKSVHDITITQSALIATIEQAMLALAISPLVVAYLLNKKLAPSLTLLPDDPLIAEALVIWHQG
jgi:hypothetical protein